MATQKTGQTTSISSMMIAPCGMNCALCIGHIRDKKPCSGCLGDDLHKPYHCVICKIKHCEELKDQKQKYCYVCRKYPCVRLRQLDKRYRTRYGMSMIENLDYLRDNGVKKFIIHEKKRWKCKECGGIVCVHREDCINCGHVRK